MEKFVCSMEMVYTGATDGVLHYEHKPTGSSFSVDSKATAKNFRPRMIKVEAWEVPQQELSVMPVRGILSGDRQKEVVELLKAVKDEPMLGAKFMMDSLREPLRLHLSDHDTGCQANFILQAEDKDTLFVWRGSVWNSPSYEFNDRVKVLGLQPGMEFVQAVLEGYLTVLKDALNEVELQRRRDQEERHAAADRKAQESLAYYKSLFQ